MPPHCGSTILSTYDIKIKFYFGNILRPLVFDLMYWPLRPLRPNFFELLKDHDFFKPKDFYIYQDDPTKCRSRSANTFLFPPTLIVYAYIFYNCMQRRLKSTYFWLQCEMHRELQCPLKKKKPTSHFYYVRSRLEEQKK